VKVTPDPREELRRVYRAHVRHVYAFFTYSVGTNASEDLTSQTFERVVSSWSRFDAARASERTWILSIARNILIDHYRRESHRQSRSIDEHPALIDALSAREDLQSAVVSMAGFTEWLVLLGEREREILALRFAGDLAPAEIATALDLTVDNVHQIISRSLRRLRESSSGRERSRTRSPAESPADADGRSDPSHPDPSR
jgi:RNA polymerase sigma factor (sigma-70 family)